jgi:hypothetical protein
MLSRILSFVFATFLFALPAQAQGVLDLHREVMVEGGSLAV